MSQIKGKNTKPEMAMRKTLHSYGFRFRLHVKNLPGTPDIVMPKYKTAIFIHGCFWHGHKNCKYFVLPKTNAEWWYDKINRNNVNDKRAELELKKLGWKVVTIWECELKSINFHKTLTKLFGKLKKNGGNGSYGAQ